jgi:hypothetical protein
MRLGQKNPRPRRWARGGTRPRALTDRRTKSAYLFGAICPQRGTGAAPAQQSSCHAPIPKRCSTTLQHHLDEIARGLAPNAPALVGLDHAGRHTTGTLRPRRTSPCRCCRPSRPS